MNKGGIYIYIYTHTHYRLKQMNGCLKFQIFYERDQNADKNPFPQNILKYLYAIMPINGRM